MNLEKKIKKNLQNGVTGVTALQSLIHLQKKVTLGCNQGVTRCNPNLNPPHVRYFDFYV